MRHHRFLLALTGLVFAASGAMFAQQKFQAVGPNECINCHDHQPERQWYERLEIPEVQRLFPDKGNTAGHINALKQMEAPKSDEYAKAIGLADKYDMNGACVKCHATVFAGDANAGVSCESCHGPASGYLKPHQTKGAYEISVKQYGQTPLVGNIQGWTTQCTNCHVMDDARLIAAGHPSGDDFNLGRMYLPVSLHFKKKYSETDVAAIGKAEMAAVIARRRPGAAPPPPPPLPVVIAPPTPMPPTPAVTQAPAPVTPPPAPRGTAPAAAPRGVPPAAPPPVTPAPAVVTPPAIVDAPPVAPVPAPAAPVTTPAPAAPAAAPSSPVAVTVGMGPSAFVFLGLIAVILVAGLVWFMKRK